MQDMANTLFINKEQDGFTIRSIQYRFIMIITTTCMEYAMLI